MGYTKSVKFLRQLLVSPIETGAIVPSSRKLSRLMANTAELRFKKSIVELGPGTGVFTREIVNCISPEALFFCLEINGQFVKETRRNCPGAIVYHASALQLKEYLQKHGLTTCDCIISGLPWGVFSRNNQDEMLNGICDALNTGGSFLAVAYISGTVFPPGIRFKKLLNEKFSKVRKTEVIWGNFLPAFVYHCIK